MNLYSETGPERIRSWFGGVPTIKERPRGAEKLQTNSKFVLGVPEKFLVFLLVISAQISLVFAQEDTTRVSFGNGSPPTKIASKSSGSLRLMKGNTASDSDREASDREAIDRGTFDGEATTTRIKSSDTLRRLTESNGVHSPSQENGDVTTGDSATAVNSGLEDWQLSHNTARPFIKYFIDVRVVGAVRYQADFNLEKSYDILRELTNIQRDLKDYLGISPPKETIEVFFFQSEDTYRKFLAVEFPEAPYDRRALYIKQNGPGMVLIFQSPDMKEDMRHELTHAFLHASIPYVPLWLDEGLAEYFEKPRETRAVENQYFKNIAKKTVLGQPPSLARLEKIKRVDELGASEYCDAWSWVHFMIHRSRDTHELLAGYLQLLKETGEQTPPIDKYLSQMAQDPKKAYLEHFHTWKSRIPNNKKDQEELARPVLKEKKKSREEAFNANDAPDTPGNENHNRISRGWVDSLLR